MQIKICGIKSPEMAFFTAKAGAHYLGIIFDPHSKRYVEKNLAKKIAKAGKEGGAKIVGVFVEHTGEEMLSIYRDCGLDLVQLHGEKAMRESLLLPANIPRIFVNTPPEDFDRGRDFLLYDQDVPGQGNPLDWENISPNRKCAFFLAGGLSSQNVGKAIAKVQPFGVDISSGVENLQGEKDKSRITAFIAACKKDKEWFGDFGGAFVPEILIPPLEELAEKFRKLHFQHKLEEILENYAGRPTPLTEAKRFAKAVDGPRILLKREDLLHTGAHKLNNSLGQCLLAKEMGKKRVIAETGAGQHGVATATACAFLGLKCVIYMGKKDMVRQEPNVKRMQLLGAEVISVKGGQGTLKDAVNEALRDWATNFEDTHYCIGSAVGPYPFPEMVAFFQSVIGKEAKEQCIKRYAQNPDLIIACVGGGSNAIGIFSPFLEDENVKLIGVEAGGKSLKPGEHASRFSGGKPGVMHGAYSYVLQDECGQIQLTHSISAGLDYPCVGPHHAHLHQIKRAEYVSISDEEAIEAMQLLSKTEGIIPALESAHALAYAKKIAPTLPKDALVLINLSGRGDKDLPQLFDAACISHKLCSGVGQTVILDESKLFEGKVLCSDEMKDASVHPEVCEKRRLERRRP